MFYFSNFRPDSIDAVHGFIYPMHIASRTLFLSWLDLILLYFLFAAGAVIGIVSSVFFLGDYFKGAQRRGRGE